MTTRIRRVLTRALTHYVALAGALLFLPIPAAAQPSPPAGDHFKCYAIRDRPVDVTVLVVDQWDKTFLEVRNPVRLCNPVKKTYLTTVTPITNDLAHLKLYLTVPQQFDALLQERSVTVSNQFTGFQEQKLQVGRPLALGVPTWKNVANPAEPAPPNLSHFNCYAARGGNPRKRVDLEDQFDLEQNVKVGKPVVFCNPAQKRPPDGEISPLFNPETHLVCYRITKRDGNRLDPPILTGPVLATNQFGRETFDVGAPDLLCVPSYKVRWEFIP